MSLLTRSAASAGIALAALSVFGVGTASAQEDCAYGQTCSAAAISDSTPVAGQRVTVTSGSGEFTPGSEVTLTVFGRSLTLEAAPDGSATATFVVPNGQRLGRYNAVFRGTLDGEANSVTIGFTVVGTGTRNAGNGGGNGNNNGGGGSRDGQLPRTGSDLVPLGATGLGLVGAGVLTVVVARRRRESVSVD